MTIETLRERADKLLDDIKTELSTPEQIVFLREIRARCSAAIETDAKKAARTANMTRLNEARQAYGVSIETRQKLSDAKKRYWAQKKAAK